MRFRAYTLDADGDPQFLLYVAEADAREKLIERLRAVTFLGTIRTVETRQGTHEVDMSRLLLVDSISGTRATFVNGAIVYGATLTDGVSVRDRMN